MSPSEMCDSARETASYHCMYVHWPLQFMHCWPCIVLDISVPPSAAQLPSNAAGILYTHKRVRATKSEVVHEVNHWPVGRLK